MKLDPEAIDLSWLAREISARLSGDPAVGYVVGKTRLRDAVVEKLGCSELEAEELVDTMALRGFLRFEQPPGTLGEWQVLPGGAA